MLFHKIIPLLFSLLIFSHVICALAAEEMPIGADILAPLARWVEQATHVTITALPITVASNRRLKMSLGLQGVQRAHAAAAYLPGQIIIDSNLWDPDS